MRSTINMFSPRYIRLAFFMLFVAFALFVVSGSSKASLGSTGRSAARATQVQPNEKTAEQAYKNIQVLKDLRANELDGVMQFMCASLGVGCTYCHTNPWESDDKSPKLAARRMILMTRAINKDHFSSNPAVTCYTCHHGQHNSVPNPPADLRAPDEEPTVVKPQALPATDEIIDRYIRAIGGEAAIDKLKTRMARGSETTSNLMGPPVTSRIEIYQTAANKFQLINGDSNHWTVELFDGARGWTKDVREIPVGGVADGVKVEVKPLEAESELQTLRREADFYRYLRLKSTYPQLRVLTREKVAGRDAYVVGATSRDDSREKLYFDVQTCLLIRRLVAFKTAFGTIPDLTDFGNYGDAGGLKLPFTITWSRGPFSAVRRFTEIELNVIINDSIFAPESK